MQTEEAPFITMETSDGVNSTNSILPTTPWWVYHPLYVKPPWWLDIVVLVVFVLLAVNPRGDALLIFFIIWYFFTFEWFFRGMNPLALPHAGFSLTLFILFSRGCHHPFLVQSKSLLKKTVSSNPIKLFPYIDSDGVELCHKTENIEVNQDFYYGRGACLTPDLPKKRCKLYNRISEDLKPFQSGISSVHVQNSFFSIQYKFKKVLVRICSGKVEIYAHNNKHKRSSLLIRAYGIKMLLIDLLNRVSLPDIEFVLSFGDAPSIPKKIGALPSFDLNLQHPIRRLPVFSICKNSDFYDILFPFSLLHHGFIERGICKKLQEIPWESRVSKLSTRFSTSRFATSRWLHENEPPSHSPRATYAKISDKDGKDIDIKFVNIPTDLAREIGLSRADYGQAYRTPFLDKFKYKYLFTVDGNGYQSSFKNIARGGSLIFKGNTFDNGAKATFEHWYSALFEDYHLIGIHNSSDIRQKLMWAREHDIESKMITRRMGAKVEQLLSKDYIQCYLYRLLLSYADLVQYSACFETSISSNKIQRLVFDDKFKEKVKFMGKSNPDKDNFLEWCLHDT